MYSLTRCAPVWLPREARNLSYILANKETPHGRMQVFPAMRRLSTPAFLL